MGTAGTGRTHGRSNHRSTGTYWPLPDRVCLHLYTVSFKGRGLLESWRPSGPVSRSIVGDLGHFQSRLADTDHGGLERQFCRPQDEAAGSFQTKPAFPSTATAGVARPPSVSVPNVAPGNPLRGCGRGRTRDPKMESPQRKRVLAGFFHAPIPIWSQATRNSRSFHVGACRAQRRCRY